MSFDSYIKDGTVFKLVIRDLGNLTKPLIAATKTKPQSIIYIFTFFIKFSKDKYDKELSLFSYYPI